MKKIKYKIVDVPKFGKDFIEDLNRKNYLYITNFTIDKFLTYNPPCKECIVQAVCLHNSTAIVTKYSRYIYLSMCDELKNFVTYDERFYK